MLYQIIQPADALHLYLKSLDLVNQEIIWLRKSEWEKNGKTLSLIEVFLPNPFI
jgi:hypothetical protein